MGFKPSRSSRAIASARSSAQKCCWSAVSLDAPSVALRSLRSDTTIQERMDLGATSSCRPAAVGLR